MSSPAQSTPASSNVRVLSGMRPTGPLHLGHYFGALVNWLKMQEEGAECFFMTADWHALTTAYSERSQVAKFRREMVADWLAVGLDPEKSVVFPQASVLQHAELSTLLGMLTPIPWLERVPSYKEMRQELADRDLSTIGFLNYPVLQTADILLYRATHVPVGEDQLAHVELSRQIVRRFNHYFKTSLPEPEGRVTKVRRLVGLDNRKMSKSYNNAIYLSDTPEEMKGKVMPAPTDPARVRRTDPGNPEVCNIFAYHKVVQDADTVAEIDSGCRTAGIGCVDCKRRLLSGLDAFVAPIRQRRLAVLDSGRIDDVLANGAARAQVEAEQTMEQVRDAVGI